VSKRKQESNEITIELATSVAQIERSFAVIVQLRPDLKKAEYVQRAQRQEESGYLLACLEQAGKVKAVAGFRLGETLWRGKHVYVDDLVTDQEERSKGYGALLFEWLVAYARRQGCNFLDLDSGVHRRDAHRFYFARGMHISSFHFSLALD
jgi:GNAT superfamily N-acetyltransferase